MLDGDGKVGGPVGSIDNKVDTVTVVKTDLSGESVAMPTLSVSNYDSSEMLLNDSQAIHIAGCQLYYNRR